MLWYTTAYTTSLINNKTKTKYAILLFIRLVYGAAQHQPCDLIFLHTPNVQGCSNSMYYVGAFVTQKTVSHAICIERNQL